jgi:hypothetical protein
MEARFVERLGDGIKIELENGRIFTLPLSRFSNSDQEYVTSLDGLIAEPIARSEINYGGQSEKLNNFINLKRLNKLELIFTPQKDPPLNKKGLKELAIMLPDTEIYLKTRNW